jgi:hypothetical protein
MFEDFEVLQPQLQSRPSKLGIKLEKNQSFNTPRRWKTALQTAVVFCNT